MQPLVYIDTSEVREGAPQQLKDGIGALADFVEENERQLTARYPPTDEAEGASAAGEASASSAGLRTSHATSAAPRHAIPATARNVTR